MRVKLTKSMILAIMIMLTAGNAVYGSFNRTTGLINIPTAGTTLKEGDFEKGLLVNFSSEIFTMDMKLNYGINDRCEIGISIFDAFGSAATKANFHWQVLGGKKIQMALGIQNIPLAGDINLVPNSLSPYAVFTLYVIPSMSLNVGMGGGRFRSETLAPGFGGFFAGIEFLIKSTKLGFEYDGNWLNVGIKYNLTPNIILEGAGIRLNDTAKGLAATVGVSIIDFPKRQSAEISEGVISKDEITKIINDQIMKIMPIEEKPAGPGMGETPGGRPTGIKEDQATMDNLAFEHAQAGTRYYFQGEYAKAVDEFKMAIAMNENIFIFHCQLGSVYYKLGMIDSAVSEWNRALEINPNDKNLSEFLLKVLEGKMEADLAPR